MRDNQTHIQKLPDEILMHIFRFLDVTTLQHAAMTQRNWHQLLNDTQFWAMLLLRNYAQFHPNISTIKALTTTPKETYLNEYKMKTIIQHLVYEKPIPQILADNELLWKILYQRMFVLPPKQQNISWQSRVTAMAGQMHKAANKLLLLVRSNYADLLVAYIKKYTEQNRPKTNDSMRINAQPNQLALTELINHDNFMSTTPLCIAVIKGYLNIVKILITHQANVNQADKKGATPLLFASEKGHFKIAKLLIDHKANVNQCMKFGGSPLYFATANGHYEVAKLLIEHKAKVNQYLRRGESPLLIASQKGYLEIVKLLIDNQAIVNHAMYNGATALFLAAENNHQDIVELLIANQANVNQPMDNGATPLCMAAKHGYLAIAKLLVDNHADVNKATKSGVAPLFCAALNGHVETVKLLIDNNANVNQTENKGGTPLSAAARVGNIQIIKLLIDNHANIDQAINDGRTPLFVAARKGHFDIVKMLIQHGADYQSITPQLLNNFPNVLACCLQAKAERLQEMQQNIPAQVSLPRRNTNSSYNPVAAQHIINHSDLVNASINRMNSALFANACLHVVRLPHNNYENRHSYTQLQSI